MEKGIAYQRTDRVIIEAMIRLLKEKSFEKITVQNILEEAMITRATFYAHFRDKYEVAERMQELYLQAFQEIPNQIAAVDRKKYPEIIHRNITKYGDFVQALTKIHTEKGNLRSLIAQANKEIYLNGETSECPEVEAEIYAQAMTAFQLSFMNGSADMEDEDFYDRVMVPVFLRILRLEHDKKLKKMIYERLPSNVKP